MKKNTLIFRNGRQVVIADPEKVKAAMKPATAKTNKPKKERTLPGMSEATQKVKDEVFAFAAKGYPKILPYFTSRNPDYRVTAKYLGPEDVLHIAICALLREYYPTFKVSHAKNESKEGHVGQAKKKLMGVESGFSDLMIQKPDIMAVLFMEIKVKPNGLSKEQRDFLQFQREAGHYATCAYSISEAAGAISIFDQYTK